VCSHFLQHYRVVRIWIRLWAGQSRVRILARTNILLFTKPSRLGPPVCYWMGTGILSLRVNWPGLEAVHSILKVINEWNYNFPPTSYADGMERNVFFVLYRWVRSWNILNRVKTVTLMYGIVLATFDEPSAGKIYKLSFDLALLWYAGALIHSWPVGSGF